MALTESNNDSLFGAIGTVQLNNKINKRRYKSQFNVTVETGRLALLINYHHYRTSAIGVYSQIRALFTAADGIVSNDRKLISGTAQQIAKCIICLVAAQFSLLEVISRRDAIKNVT